MLLFSLIFRYYCHGYDDLLFHLSWNKMKEQQKEMFLKTHIRSYSTF